MLERALLPDCTDTIMYCHAYSLLYYYVIWVPHAWCLIQCIADSILFDRNFPTKYSSRVVCTSDVIRANIYKCNSNKMQLDIYKIKLVLSYVTLHNVLLPHLICQ